MKGIDLSVAIEPEEPVLFGDNRSARAGEDHALSDQDPSPATIYGAIGARIAWRLGVRGPADWQPTAAEVLGEFASELGAEVGQRAELRGYALRDREGRAWFPRPLHQRIERIGSDLFGLARLRPAGEAEAVASSLPYPRRLTDGGNPQAPRPEEAEEELFVDESLLARILAASDLGTGTLNLQARGREHLFRAEIRAGIGMDNDANAAAEGLFFSRPYRRFASGFGSDRPRWSGAGFLAWYSVRSLARHEPADWNGTAFLGGDRRRARLAFAALAGDPLATVLDSVREAVEESRGYLAYLLTPALAEGPLALNGREPVAAAIGRPFQASGWNAAQGAPRPILTLLPAGSVFFYEWKPGLDAAGKRALVANLWLASLAPGYGAAGFGRVLVGVWK